MTHADRDRAGWGRLGSPSARAWRGFEGLMQLDPLEPRRFLSGDGVIDVVRGLPDLQVTIADTFVPPVDALSGTGRSFNLPLDVLNIDATTDAGRTVATAPDAQARIVVMARRADGENNDEIQVGELNELALGGLPVGASLRINVPITLGPDVGTVPGSDYRLVAYLDINGQIIELGEDPSETQENNVAQTEAFAITMGRPDLTVAVVNDNALPVSTMSGTGATYKITFRVTNNGTVALASDATTSVTVKQVSLNAPGGASYASKVVGSPIAVNVGGLRPGGSVTGTATVWFSSGVNAGVDNEGYYIETDVQLFKLTVDADDTIQELDEETTRTGPTR